MGIYEWCGFWVWASTPREALCLIAFSYLGEGGSATLHELVKHRKPGWDWGGSQPIDHCRRVAPGEQIEMVAGWYFDDDCLIPPFTASKSPSAMVVVRLSAGSLEDGLRLRENRAGVFYVEEGVSMSSHECKERV